MFAPPQEELDHAGFTPPEEELDEAPKKELAPEGFWGTAGRELASKIAPAAGAAAGGLGAGLLAIESGPGAIAADIAAGTAAGAGTEALQRKVMGDEWSDQNIAQMEANAKAHPHAAMIGSALPFILSALGGGRSVINAAGRKAAKGFAEGAAGLPAKEAMDKAAESFLPSATGFGRSQAASAAEGQVDTGNFDPAAVGKEAGLGFATGGLMHFIPAADLKNPETWGKFAKEALYSVTGKAAGDATTMVVANKAYDHFVNGKPFDMSDVVGDSAAATLDFALLNALHVGIASKGFGKVMADRTKQNELQSQKEEAVSKAADLAEGVNPELAPDTSKVVNEIVSKAATAPIKEPEAKDASEEEAVPVPEPTIIPPLNKEGPAGVSSKLVIPPPGGTDQPGYRHHASPEHQEYDQLRGWKLHLHVDPQNYKAVDSWLDKNHPGLYKLLQGGDPGYFTVYVGDKDKAQFLADKAKSEIGGLLNSSENAVNEGDTAFNDKVAARFDVQRTGPQKEVPWIYYGVNGIPFDEDAAMHGWYSNWGPRPDPSTSEGRAAIRQKNAERIHDELTKKYGERYTGSRPEISSLDAVPGDKVSFEGRNGTLVAIRSNPLSQGKTRTAHVKFDDGTELLFHAENPDLKYSRSHVKPITPVASEPATKLAPETPPDASQPPSAVITPETPSDTLEALERAKEQVSWDLTPEERSQIEAMVRKRHAGKPPQVVDELAEDAVQATRRSALSQKYARKFQEIAEQIKGISGPGKAPEPSTEPGNFPSAPERADLAKRQPAPKEKAVSEAEPPRIEGASFQDSEGKVHTAGDHVTAAALAGVEAPMDRPGRETAPYGFKLENQEKPLSREEATELVRGTKPTTSGKAKPHPQYRSGKEVGGRRKLLHSNEVRMEHQMSLKEVPEFREEISGKEPIPSQAKFEAAYQKDFLKDHGETREEFLNRKICGG